MKRLFPLTLLTCSLSHGANTAYTIQDAGTFPSSLGPALAEFQAGDVNTRNGAPTPGLGLVGFHGIGGSAVDNAYGFTTTNASISGSGTLIDDTAGFTLGIGDRVDLQMAVGGFNVGAGTNTNLLNEIMQIGVTTANSGDAFAVNSLFLSGSEGTSAGGSNVDVNFRFLDEVGMSGSGSIGSANLTHSFAGVSNNMWAMGLSFQRNADGSISWGLALDEWNMQGTPAFTSQDLTATGTLTLAQHGLGNLDGVTLYPAIGYSIVDRSVIAVSGASYDSDSGVSYRLAPVPEPSSSILALLGVLGVCARRKRKA